MNVLLEKEGMAGKVQMIYIDPPYGIRYGSNFQPFVDRREVKDGNDADLTQEPEMIKAFRDTWELGIHSYLTYFIVCVLSWMKSLVPRTLRLNRKTRNARVAALFGRRRRPPGTWRRATTYMEFYIHGYLSKKLATMLFTACSPIGSRFPYATGKGDS
jgi:hypothetical protein